MSFTPDSEIGIELKNLLINEIQRRFSRSLDDASDISDYLIYLIANQKNHDEIVNEVKDIADIPIDTLFVQEVFVEIQKLENKQNQTGVIIQDSEEPKVSASSNENPWLQPNQQHHAVSVTLPSGPKRELTDEERRALREKRFGTVNNSTRSHNGISKTSRHDRNGHGHDNRHSRNNDRHTQRLTKALESQQGNINFTNKLQIPKGRCPNFPKCDNKQCELAHPTKTCFSWPNCPNPSGTCNFLHPDQDQELMEKLEQSQKQFEEKKLNKLLVSQGSCKFGLKCAKESCPFAHPSPVNENAKIETLEWCSQGKNCQDPNCTKSHPPPPTATKEPLQSATEIALEQCKFGSQCTNYKCPRRHALSTVPCRAGAECRRIDCTFAHPILEQCRFGINCKNKNCLYQHPEGRQVTSNTWSKDEGNANSTTERSFAVPEDQVMEQAVQQ
ncbi:unnamed protein product [Candida verbasci]|uniref:Nuclear polyadenylated RNA-binding protein NAB2 n=1 Tax=Candida verbasci TaxID=1227364 RepID=A0A9W4TU06_9ASCO|nr:unnamed protein product [Candida verbasci]